MEKVEYGLQNRQCQFRSESKVMDYELKIQVCILKIQNLEADLCALRSAAAKVLKAAGILETDREKAREQIDNKLTNNSLYKSCKRSISMTMKYLGDLRTKKNEIEKAIHKYIGQIHKAASAIEEI